MFRSTLPLLLLLSLAPVRAAIAGDAISVEVVSKAQEGKETPALIVRAEAAVSRLVLKVSRSTDQKTLEQSSGAVKPGTTFRFPLELKAPGKARFQGSLAAELADGQSGSMPIDVEVELLPALALSVAPSDVDLEKRKLTLKANRPLKRAQVSVTSDLGTPLGTTEVAVEGSEPVIAWEQSKGTALRIDVQAWDENNFFSAIELFPWRVDIPHEEVNFASGSHEIAASETDKLEKSYTLLKEAIERYGKLATIRLFIAGHTDTMGDAASNRALSDRRAQSIGRWFAKRGVKIPISCAGLGEDALLVKTPDQTDEARNRRAEYIVAVAPPHASGAVWKPLAR